MSRDLDVLDHTTAPPAASVKAVASDNEEAGIPLSDLKEIVRYGGLIKRCEAPNIFSVCQLPIADSLTFLPDGRRFYLTSLSSSRGVVTIRSTCKYWLVRSSFSPARASRLRRVIILRRGAFRCCPCL